MKRLEKKHLVLLGLGVLSLVFLLIPFFLEGEDNNNYLELGLDLDTNKSVFNESNLEQFDLEEDEDELDLERFEVETDFAVYVSGEVKVPGVYYLPPGSRVFEALREAGGALDNAGLDRLNLAAEISDGQHIHVPDENDEIHEREKNIPGILSQQDGNDLIDINRADYITLKELPGIGPVRAESIIDYRERTAPFSTAADIMNVPGIGSGIFEQIKDKITT